MDGISTQKYNDIISSTTTADYDVIAVPETWLTVDVSNFEFMSNKYNVFRKDRSSSNIQATRGGGVLIAVKNDVQCDEVSCPEMIPLEAVCVRISLASGSIYLYCLYIQPLADITTYQAHLAAIDAVQKLIGTQDTLQILGDFNLFRVDWFENDDGFDYVPVIGDSMSRRSIIAREVTSTMSDLGLFQMSNLANTSGNVLDLIYTNTPELCNVSKAELLILPPSKSDVDHVPLLCTIECYPIITSSVEDNLVYCFKKANYNDINDYLSNSDFSGVLHECRGNVNDSLELLYRMIFETFNKFVPRATIRSSNNPKWYNKALLHMKNIRNKEFKKLSAQRKQQLQNNIPTVLDDRNFLEAKSNYETLRSDLHNNFIIEKAHCAKTDPKSFWRHINSKRKANNLPAVIEFNEEKASTNAEKANMFAEFFKSVYVDHPCDPSLLEFIRNRMDSDFHSITTTKELVLSVLRGMDINKGSGHDGVSSLFLRECANHLAEPLHLVYNQSITERCYPDLFKIGQLTPIFKSGRKTKVENYRGVNVMPNLAKVFERVVFIQLKLIIPRDISTTQHGFLPNRNIESNLMELSTIAHDAFEQKGQLDVFNADISKAFDKVNKSKLVRKMAQFPLSNDTLLWFMSYLCSRVQYVIVGSDKSEKFLVLSGVGQGSIIGVMMFLMFFNDSDVHMPGIYCLNFADDKKIAAIIKSIEDAVNLQNAINTFFKWCNDNGMEINRSKSKIITYTLKRKPIQFDYKLDGETITRTNSMVDLGILFNTKMNFNTHFEYVKNKSKAVLKFVIRQHKYFNTDVIKILYKSLVRSNLEFAASVWSPHHVTHKQTIESTQKQFVMFLNNDYEHRASTNYVLRPYIERCMKFDLQTLIRRRANACILFIHSVITGKIVSPLLRSRITFGFNVRTLRSNGSIIIKTCRTKHSINQPFNNACRMYNAAISIIDPTLPQTQFRNMLLSLPDSVFDSFMRL